MTLRILAFVLCVVLSAQQFPPPSGGLTSVQVPIGAYFDGGGSAIVNNSITYGRVSTACTITGWSVVVDTGTITIDILRIANSDGGALPTASITGSATPSIASGNQHLSTTLTGWSTAIAADDVVAYKVTAVSGATKAQVKIKCGT